MAAWNNFFLIRIAFLGFRYHGWQKQTNLKTVQGMIDKTLTFVLGHNHFKTLGCGRTDAKVSASDFAFELFLSEKINPTTFLVDFNQNLPPDIRAQSITPVPSTFNIIQHAKIKEYHYHFCFGEKPHPFTAPFTSYIGATIDIEKMMKAASIFEGTHNFKRYATKPSPNTVFKRHILKSMIEPSNNTLPNHLSPNNQYTFKVKSNGFLRYQVRLMVGALVNVGKGTWSLDDIEKSLIDIDDPELRNIAPASGLLLHKVTMDL